LAEVLKAKKIRRKLKKYFENYLCTEFSYQREAIPIAKQNVLVSDPLISRSITSIMMSLVFIGVESR
jgi:hypothetical protein